MKLHCLFVTISLLSVITASQCVHAEPGCPDQKIDLFPEDVLDKVAGYANSATKKLQKADPTVKNLLDGVFFFQVGKEGKELKATSIDMMDYPSVIAADMAFKNALQANTYRGFMTNLSQNAHTLSIQEKLIMQSMIGEKLGKHWTANGLKTTSPEQVYQTLRSDYGSAGMCRDIAPFMADVSRS